jgi:predicted DsbA family dithiol-disulfide isomerase
MHALVWTDYLCPWCWLGRDRTRLLESLAITVTALPFELHPELPPEGRDVRPDSRLDQVFDRIGAECAELGIDFVKPTHTPNTRHVLETSEVVRRCWPESFAALDESLFRARWLERGDLGDRDLIARLVAASGAPAHDVADAVADGVGHAWVSESMERARSLGVTATPAWWVDDRLLIPGALNRDTIERWVTKMQDRSPVGPT